jgi:PKD repeat protein
MGENKVNWFRSKLFLGSLLVIVAAATASAQNYPLPSSAPNTNVPCTGCDEREGMLTPGYPPVLSFLGRFADSEKTTDYQNNFRTARAKGAYFAPEKNRVYLLLGSALAAYNTDNFFSKLAAHTSLTPATVVPTNPSNSNRRDHGSETFLYWDRFFYAENGGGWATGLADGQDRMHNAGVDWDDRKICYLAYTIFGWGMVIDDPAITDGGLMANIVMPGGGPAQFLPGSGEPNPISLISIKTTDGSYYVAVSDTNSAPTTIWNVTDYLHPVRMPNQADLAITNWTKNTGGSRIGIIMSDLTGRIYSADGLARAQGPIQKITLAAGGLYSIASDGTNFYGFGMSNGSGVIVALKANGTGGFDRTDYPVLDDAGHPVSYLAPHGIGATQGLISIFGSEGLPLLSENIRLYKLANGVPTQISLDNTVGATHAPFFAQYYGNVYPGTNFTHPSRNTFYSVRPYKYNGKMYIAVSGYGLGDVWEVKSGDNLNASIKKTADTPNPNTRGTGAGPFYGDRQTFTSALTSATPATIAWTFDDQTSGTTLPGTTDIQHQFGGITSTASLPITRHATATNTADTSMSATLTVNLAKPDVRFAVAGNPYLFVQPDASSTAPIVTSDTFIDGSDGAVEGHFAEWVLDGASTKLLPSESFPVGTCGVHTLSFLGHYGAYTGTGSSRASVGADFPIKILDSNGQPGPVVYTSRPFAVTVQPPPPIVPGAAAGNAVFTASVRPTSTAADLPSGLSTPVTYLWELVSASGTVLQSSGAADKTLGSIPQYPLDRSVFNTLGSKVRLTVSVAASAISGACSAFRTSASSTEALNAPDPTIAKTGCDAARSPCSFSVTSSGSQTGWVYAWSMSNSSATSSGPTFAPTITQGGAYTVTLIVTNSIGSVTRTLIINPTQPLCSSSPSIDNTTVSYYGCAITSQCTAGETVTFRLNGYNWTPDPVCDIASWNFGDGSAPGTGYLPTHAYASNGTYTVTLTLTGGLSTATITTPITIGSVFVQPPNPTPNPIPTPTPTPTPTPQPGVCAAQTATSAYIGFFGSQSSCGAGASACNTGEAISFVGYGQSYNFECGAATYFWNFGDNATSSDRFAQHTYATPGTYHATLAITNSGGTGSYAVNVQVGTTPTPNPTPTPTPTPTPNPQPCGNLSTQTIKLTWQGSGCTEQGGDCASTSAVSFTALGNGYSFTCGNHQFDWDYGDGSQHGTTATASHTYGNAGTYTAKLTVTYGEASITLSKSLKVTTPTGGLPGSCPLMIPDENILIVFYDGSACSNVGGNCPVGDAVQFNAYAYNYTFDCSTSHAFKWDFGDGGTSTEKSPMHAFAQNGTYRVKLNVSNSQQPGGIDLIKTVVVGTGVSVPSRRRASGH